MSGWAGFTDDELKRMKGPSGQRPGSRKPSNFTKPKSSTQQRIMAQQKKGDNPVNSVQSAVIPPEQRLPKPTQPPNNNVNPQKSEEKLIKSSNPFDTHSNKADNNGNVESRTEQKSSEVKDVQVLELDQSEALSHQMNKLEKYQQQQKQIEELNKQRKDLLSKAISERSKKAKAEATKLKHIEKELGHLDQLLTNGVTIIRDRIEQASIAYLEAQQRYQRAEKEFIESKVFLHEKAEIKEQLTEHLYTIIHQNEIRKSEKLAQLMKELEMEAAIDDIDFKVDLPPLSSFNMMQTVSSTKVLKSPSYPNTEGLECESKMVDNNATCMSPPGSEPRSESDSQPIKSVEQTTVTDAVNSNPDQTQVSHRSEETLSAEGTLPVKQQVPKQTEEESPIKSPLSNQITERLSHDVHDSEEQKQELSNHGNR